MLRAQRRGYARSAVLRTAAALGLVGTLLSSAPAAGAQQPVEPTAGPKFLPRDFKNSAGPQPSGFYEFGVQTLGTAITECPQAGMPGGEPTPLDRRSRDQVEQLSRRGDDRRANDDFSCFPQDEVSVDTNPVVKGNFVVGANDYRLGTGSSGVYATTDNGRSFYNTIIPFPSAPSSQSRGEGFIPSGGDPVIVYDRAGLVYYAQLAFFRGDDSNGVFVARSTNGGFTWSRACVPVETPNPDDPPDTSACGLPGDSRQPGDGRVTYNPDADMLADGSVPFDDKEYMAAGPRPAGVQPVCFTPVTRQPTGCDPQVVGVDRLYVTFTRFTDTASQIYLSYSDDQARSWSPARMINGSADFCAFAVRPGGCDDNQFSIPTVSPANGYLYVQFENFNTPDENQMLVVRSRDGGNTFEGPFHVTPVFDINFPRAGFTRPDCTPRDAQRGRIVYTNSCFRSNPAGNIVVDKRGGAFADDLYLVIADNRNGTVASSNADVFLFKSTDGGTTWIGPTRVNDDRSSLGSVDRDCGRTPGFPFLVVGGRIAQPPPECAGDFGNDQWWPWVDIGQQGELNIAFKDRRLDTNSVAHEWPSSRQRPGNYLVWTWGAQCQVRQADSRECLAPGADVIPRPTEAPDPGSGAVPGQGDEFKGSLRNFQISDVPSNYDYSFRNGLFAGDYENVAVFDSNLRERSDEFRDDSQGNGRGNGDGNDRDNGGSGARAITVFTDARNGRSSRNQPGRNPICEQSDVFFDIFPALNARSESTTTNYQPFLVTPCPSEAVDRGRQRGNDD